MSTDTATSPDDFAAGYAHAVADLRFLVEARSAYVHFDMDAVRAWAQLSDSDRTLMTQVQTGTQLADILEGANDGCGWLPSWLWDDWGMRRKVGHRDG